MYTAFYGLREKPFSLSPDPRFLYLAGSHREALAHLLYGIEQGEGFISVTGEVGTGKTTLCRTLLERLDGDTELAFLFNPSRTALELLQSICAEFGLPAEGLGRRSLMTQLDAFLVEQKRRDRRVLLIIDEAQTLSETTLEQVRLLSNLETSREKLIQILLLGQPELDRKLDSRGLRQLRQRISVRWKLEPLTPPETRAYVRHRLAVAAGAPKDLFSEAALREVHRRTGGVPRLINQLCDRALLAGYASRSARIRQALIRAAAREIPDARRGRKETESELGRSSLIQPWSIFAGSIALVLLALFAGLQVGRSGLTNAIRFSDNSVPPVGQFVSTDGLASRPTGDDPARVMPPAVGANAPSTPLLDAATPIARAIGFVSSESGDPPSQNSTRLVASSIPATFLAASTSIAIPEPPQPRAMPVEALEVTALSPGLLPRLLATRNRRLAMAESQRAILEGFGRRVPALAAAPRTTAALRSEIEGHGLTATPFDGGSIDLLRRLDHPVLLPLSPARTLGEDGRISNPSASNSDLRWLAVIGFDDDRAYVAGLIADRIVTIPIDELAAHWLETGMIVWERFDAVPTLLQMGEAGKGVLWLQRALAELDYFKGHPNGTFDGKTLVALTRFQRERGLVSDGIAGPLTQIAIYGQLDRYPVPRLSRDLSSSDERQPSLARPQTFTPAPAPDRTQVSERYGDRG